MKQKDIKIVMNSSEKCRSANLEDLKVIAEVLSGNKQEYSRIIKKYQTKLYNIALRMTHNRDESLDVVQESFIAAYYNLNKYNTEKAFLPWIVKITCNNALQTIKKRKKVSDIKNFEHLLSSNDNIEKKLFVEKILNDLPADYRLIIELKHFQDYSYEAIAVELEISLAAVKSKLFRARKQLQEILRRNYEL